MQEMRISQFVLDQTSHVDSKNLKARSSPWCGETQSSFFTLSCCEHAARDRDQKSASSG